MRPACWRGWRPGPGRWRRLESNRRGRSTTRALRWRCRCWQLRSLTDRLEVTITSEVLTRGTADATGLSPVDWIVDQQGSAAPRPDPRRVATVVRVAEAGTSREPGGQAICAAVQAGVLPVRSAAQIARFVRDVKPLADPAVLEQDVAVLCAAASDGPDGRGLPDRELVQAVRYANNLTRADRGLDGDEDRCRQARALWSGPGPAGMTSYRMLLDPEAAAAVDLAISGLSAPVKGPDREPDLRPAARRRADALLEAIRRRAAASTDLPGGTKTQIVVTIPLADLNEQVRGAGLTTTGELLSPATVRRLACDAQLIPMVSAATPNCSTSATASATSPPLNAAPSPAATDTAPTPPAPSRRLVRHPPPALVEPRRAH